MSDIIRIPLSKGRFAIVDAADAEITTNKWSLHSNGYAERKIYNPNTKRSRSMLMHREIMSRIIGRSLEGRWEQVDHANGDKLDNRRSNLRLCRPSQNSCNSTVAPGVSGYRGVSYDSRYDTWMVRIQVDRVSVNMGHYETPEIAARIFDIVAAKYYQQFARLNFPDEWTWSESEGIWVKNTEPCLLPRHKKPRKSSYVGVSRHGNRWIAVAKEGWLGSYQCEIAAAKRFDECLAARGRERDRHRFNFPDEWEWNTLAGHWEKRSGANLSRES